MVRSVLMSKQAKIPHSGRLYRLVGWSRQWLPFGWTFTGWLGWEDGRHHRGLASQARERQLWRSRDKKLSGAKGTTPYPISLAHEWPQWGTLVRDEVKAVSKARPSSVCSRIKSLDLILIWVGGWGMDTGNSQSHWRVFRWSDVSFEKLVCRTGRRA